MMVLRLRPSTLVSKTFLSSLNVGADVIALNPVGGTSNPRPSCLSYLPSRFARGIQFRQFPRAVVSFINVGSVCDAGRSTPAFSNGDGVLAVRFHCFR